MSTTTVLEDVRPVTETLNDLLAGLGLCADANGPELTIDRFDAWTNPDGPVPPVCSCLFQPDADSERM
jgi:hypothetical protein